MNNLEKLNAATDEVLEKADHDALRWISATIYGSISSYLANADDAARDDNSAQRDESRRYAETHRVVSKLLDTMSDLLIDVDTEVIPGVQR